MSMLVPSYPRYAKKSDAALMISVRLLRGATNAACVIVILAETHLRMDWTVKSRSRRVYRSCEIVLFFRCSVVFCALRSLQGPESQLLRTTHELANRTQCLNADLTSIRSVL